MQDDIQDIRLSQENIKDIICCPGGLEVAGKEFKGDLRKTTEWHMKMFEEGMTGFVSYKVDTPRGFVEYMPAEMSPFPIKAPGGAVIMCYHWAAQGDEEEHLEQEKRLLELVIEDSMERYDSLIALAWDNPVHFPIDMMEELGFKMVENYGEIALMWLPFKKEAIEPEIPDDNHEPKDLSDEGKLVIESAYSNRCPYSIHTVERVKEIIESIDDERIEYREFQIDTHEDALNYNMKPFDWGWHYLNGEKIPVFQESSEEIRAKIQEKLDDLESE